MQGIDGEAFSMHEHDEFQVADWLREGIAAAKAGKRAEARELLTRVIEVNERSEQAWLWLARMVDSDEDRLVCLENVLTLDPDNVQARAGMKWLQARGVGTGPPAPPPLAHVEAQYSTPTLSDEDQWSVSTPALPEEVETPLSTPPPAAQHEFLMATPEPETFMTPDGCVFCGLVVNERDPRCPHCGGRLTSKQFKKAERSPIGYLLHAYWLLLAGVNLADYFLIGYIWENLEDIPELIQKYLPYAVGPVVTGSTTLETFFEPDVLIQLVRYTLLGLAVLSCLVALGVFLRRPLAHTSGVALIGLQLILGLALFVLGFLGYIMAVLRALFTVMLTVFMFNTVEDFAKEERRERLEPDRRAVNDADFYTRGRAYEKRGMWAKALLHWQRAAAINPARDTYYAAMARAYTHLGRYDQALKQIDEALRVSRTPEEWHPLREAILEAQQRAAARRGTVNR